ncbi:MAG: pyrrolo-quinoline quinone, partial [Planctomycetes bacterium]|nr:pyrrolo-quinoline quinone [Planctomycetota bacterium]
MGREPLRGRCFLLNWKSGNSVWSESGSEAPMNIGDKVRHITVDEDAVYVQARSGMTTAFSAETGQQLWAIQLGRFDQPSFPVVSNENLALIVVGSTMYGVDKRSGGISWQLVVPGQPSTAPAVDEDQLYLGTLDGGVFAFNIRTIRKLHQQQKLPQWSHDALVWRYRAGKEITSPPIPVGRAVVLGSRDGALYSINAIDRSLIFQLETDGAIVAPLARVEQTVFMASEDNTFYSLDLAAKGQILWKFTTGRPVRKAPVIVGPDLFILPERGGIVSLDPATGKERWAMSNVTNFHAVVGKSLFVSNIEGNLIQIARASGAVQGTLPAKNFSVQVANDRTNRIFLANDRGLVVGLRGKGETLPTYHKFPDRLPILPFVTPEDGSNNESPKGTEDETAA